MRDAVVLEHAGAALPGRTVDASAILRVLNTETARPDNSKVSQVSRVYVLLGAFAVLYVSANFVGGSRYQRRIEEWAAQNDFRLQSTARKWGRGEHPGESGVWGEAPGFFRVTVIDAAGQWRSGWIRFRASLVGGRGTIEVRWPA